VPPKRRQCGTMPRHERLSETYKSYRDNQDRIERFTERSIVSGQAESMQETLITIPVVVHVVYGTAAQNVSDTQVASQIAALNRDFRAKNADRSKVPPVWKGLVTDTRINIALAGEDPDGAPTSGITRTHTTRSAFPSDDSMKTARGGGIGPWPSDSYLNLWVCNLAEDLGYAQFPGGPAATDGVVILTTAFGTTGTAAAPFHRGRTATHEVGHWLNLRHIWADTHNCAGTDFVSDTPNARGPNYGKPRFPHISCNNGPSGDMFMNYMDYVDDPAMLMFTVGQSIRMNAALAGPRSSIGG
jgi:Pregnancy-associated plasma protein-A